MLNNEKSRIIVALDNMTAPEAIVLISKIKDIIAGVKVGSEMFIAEGPDFLRYLRMMGVAFFLDMKIHDIPNTVAKAMAAAVQHGPAIINLHASGGFKMMQAAAEGVERGFLKARERGLVQDRPHVIAVTILTSIGESDLIAVGLLDPKRAGGMTFPELLDFIPGLTLKMSRLAVNAGLSGCVCAVSDAKNIRAECGPRFMIITPGIRLPGGDIHDQKRIDTPTAAIEAGADYLVVGRAVTESDEPVGTCERINQDVARALIAPMLKYPAPSKQ